MIFCWDIPYNNNNSYALNLIIIVTNIYVYIYFTSRRSCDLDIQDVISKLEKVYREQKLKIQEAKFNKDWYQMKNLFLT